MAQKKIQKTKGGNKKHGRSKVKEKGRTSAISFYVRGLITADQYFKNPLH